MPDRDGIEVEHDLSLQGDQYQAVVGTVRADQLLPALSCQHQSGAAVLHYRQKERMPMLKKK